VTLSQSQHEVYNWKALQSSSVQIGGCCNKAKNHLPATKVKMNLLSIMCQTVSAPSPAEKCNWIICRKFSFSPSGTFGVTPGFGTPPRPFGAIAASS